MPRTCTICHHPDREEIDRSLVGNESFRHIAARFGTSSSSLQRHKSDHLPAALVKAHEVREVTRADSIWDDVRIGEERVAKLWDHVDDILERARTAKDDKTRLAGINAAQGLLREGRGFLTLRAEVTNELNKAPTVNIDAREARILMLPSATRPEPKQLTEPKDTKDKK